MAKVTLYQADIEKDPNLIWNSFIDVVGGDESEPRSEVQQWAHYCFRYYGEVMNGGHLQFFENNGLVYSMLVLSSLEHLAMVENHKILTAALQKAQHQRWGEAEIEEFIEMSQGEPFREQDDAYYALKPDLLDRLQEYATAHMEEFFEIITP